MNYAEHYNRLIERAKHREVTGYYETHHITPKCMGGDDNRNNLVKLYPEEHYVAHQLLVKMYPHERGLVWAATQMSSRKGNKLYGWLRRQLSIVAKQRVGSRNGSYGTMWVSNTATGDSMKISKDETIPIGWVRGRIIDKTDILRKLKQQMCVVCSEPCGDHKYCDKHAAEARSLACKRNGARDGKKGRRYVNNGLVQRTIGQTDPIPDGFSVGGLPRKRK